MRVHRRAHIWVLIGDAQRSLRTWITCMRCREVDQCGECASHMRWEIQNKIPNICEADLDPRSISCM